MRLRLTPEMIQHSGKVVKTTSLSAEHLSGIQHAVGCWFDVGGGLLVWHEGYPPDH